MTISVEISSALRTSAFRPKPTHQSFHVDRYRCFYDPSCKTFGYISVKNGFLSLVAIMDWATCKVLTWRLSNTLDASFCVEALEEAIARHGKPEIMNTDQGSQ